MSFQFLGNDTNDILNSAPGAVDRMLDVLYETDFIVEKPLDLLVKVAAVAALCEYPNLTEEQQQKLNVIAKLAYERGFEYVQNSLDY